MGLLSAPLDRANVRQREQGRGRVSYLEGWQVIAEANRIFGFDGWERCRLISRCVAEHERPIGRDRKKGWGLTYTARVRITVTGGNRNLIREGSGAGHGIDADKALAPARLEAFSKGFRAAFQVPDAQPSLAGLITTIRHQRWIESFLGDAPAA
ncbi:MAG: hypothetical protein RLZZ263_911 [Cyanobacteriota bacterium]